MKLIQRRERSGRGGAAGQVREDNRGPMRSGKEESRQGGQGATSISEGKRGGRGWKAGWKAGYNRINYILIGGGGSGRVSGLGPGRWGLQRRCAVRYARPIPRWAARLSEHARGPTRGDLPGRSDVPHRPALAFVQGESSWILGAGETLITAGSSWAAQAGLLCQRFTDFLYPSYM